MVPPSRRSLVALGSVLIVGGGAAFVLGEGTRGPQPMSWRATMPTVPLPQGMSYVAFTRDVLTPEVRRVTKDPLRFVTPPSFQLYGMLTRDAAEKFRASAGISNESAAEYFFQLGQRFEGAVAHLNHPETDVRDRTGEVLSSGSRNDALAWALTFAAFEARRGVHAAADGFEHSVYFAPFNGSHLRIYTVGRDDSFDDKTYAQLCVSMADASIAPFLNALIDTAANGFQRSTLDPLPPNERRLVFDVIAISIAECFLRYEIVKDSKRARCGATLEAAIIAGYLRSGGAVEGVEAGQQGCEFLFFFRKSNAVRHRFAQFATAWAARRNPKAFSDRVAAERDDAFAEALEGNGNSKTAAVALSTVVQTLATGGAFDPSSGTD